MTDPVATPTGQGRSHNLGLTVVGVAGELLVTAGVFVFLFLGWQLWLNDLILGAEQRGEALALSQEFEAAAAPATPAQTPDGEPDPDSEAAEPLAAGEPVVATASAVNTRFANLFVPRFGDGYVRSISEGVAQEPVLSRGVGHYPGTQMPGEIGNFAIAAHRTTHGAPFNQISELEVGDRIYVQTADGWYTYVFRSVGYVRPTRVDVIQPVPQFADVDPTARILTMTSCNPLLSSAERIIAYSVFESWQPASAGPPAEIAAVVQAGA